MKQHLGMLLQLIALGGLPALIFFELQFRLLIVMPIGLMIGGLLFLIGTKLRESR